MNIYIPENRELDLKKTERLGPVILSSEDTLRKQEGIRITLDWKSVLAIALATQAPFIATLILLFKWL